jgi:hypothetical protein
MSFATVAVASAVLATADFCANPIEGGVGEPQFCRLTAAQQIDTPIFSLTVDPTFLVGIDRRGRRLVLQPSLWQSQVSVYIEALSSVDRSGVHASTIRRHAEGKLACSLKTVGGATWDHCTENLPGDETVQFYFLRKPEYLVLMAHHSSKLGRAFTPAVHRLLETVVVHGL